MFDLASFFSYFFCYFAYRMKKYSIEVKEVLSRIVEVEAQTEAKAIEMVRQMYLNCAVVLDSSDYETTEFSAKDEKSE